MDPWNLSLRDFETLCNKVGVRSFRAAYMRHTKKWTVYCHLDEDVIPSKPEITVEAAFASAYLKLGDLLEKPSVIR